MYDRPGRSMFNIVTQYSQVLCITENVFQFCLSYKRENGSYVQRMTIRKARYIPACRRMVPVAETRVVGERAHAVTSQARAPPCRRGKEIRIRICERGVG